MRPHEREREGERKKGVWVGRFTTQQNIVFFFKFVIALIINYIWAHTKSRVPTHQPFEHTCT